VTSVLVYLKKLFITAIFLVAYSRDDI